MAISVVNGFLCYSSCDAAKAAKGQNPHPRADVAGQGTDTSRRDGAAVILDGALKVSAGDRVVSVGADQANAPTTPRNQGSSTNILA